ncbi:MAG TPA: FG-GAP repeat protein, partial [Blastocatellia bacterium]|nr:FG-GAP repeat protein [Blastocatellia bacterium]
MEFINYVSHSSFFVPGAVARKLWLLAVCALLAAAGLARFNSRPVQAKQGTPFQGESAVKRLKTGGGYASLAQALLVDDAPAPYLSTIDPLLIQRQKLTAVDGAASNYFGAAVAFSGNTLVIGAPNNNGMEDDQGSVYVFTRNGATWTLQQKLTARDGAANSGFGFSIAISGDTVVIGALSDDIGANRDQGSAYVFTRSGAVWTQQQKLIAQDGAANDIFGYSVAISGDTVVIGAPLNDIGASRDQGSAYVFTRNGAVWTQQQKLTANDGAANDSLGGSVAISGDTVVVGENIDKVGATEGHGSAYVFTRNGTVWTQQQKLIA